MAFIVDRNFGLRCRYSNICNGMLLHLLIGVNMHEDMFLSELKEDLKFIRNWSSSIERKIEPLFKDLYKMSNTLQTIQNHKTVLKNCLF